MLTETRVGNLTTRVLINCNADIGGIVLKLSNVRGLEIWWRTLANYEPIAIEKIVEFHPYESLEDKNYFNVRISHNGLYII